MWDIYIYIYIYIFDVAEVRIDDKCFKDKFFVTF